MDLKDTLYNEFDGSNMAALMKRYNVTAEEFYEAIHEGERQAKEEPGLCFSTVDEVRVFNGVRRHARATLMVAEQFGVSKAVAALIVEGRNKDAFLVYENELDGLDESEWLEFIWSTALVRRS